MAPVRKRTGLRARTSRSANDVRGNYAPAAANAAPTADSEALEDASPADLHSGPPSSSKRSADDAFGFDDGFKVSKKDKRTIRHNQLLAKVQDADARVGKKKLKRRRPAKKLSTNLDSLADALPDTEDSVVTGAAGDGDEDEWEGMSEDDEEDGGEGMAGIEGFRKAKRRRRAPAGEGKMVMRSLRHRPGAMKRKRRMEQGEMERFGRNLAQMVGNGQATVNAGKGGSGGAAAKGDKAKTAAGGGNVAVGADSASQANRWAALRRFIGGTMEQNAAFAAAKK